MKEHKTISVDTDTYNRLNDMACREGRSIVGQLRWLLTAVEKHYTVTKIEPLPHPEDAEPVNMVTIQEVQS